MTLTQDGIYCTPRHNVLRVHDGFTMRVDEAAGNISVRPYPLLYTGVEVDVSSAGFAAPRDVSLLPNA
jgi:hypothetical protein